MAKAGTRWWRRRSPALIAATAAGALAVGAGATLIAVALPSAADDHSTLTLSGVADHALVGAGQRDRLRLLVTSSGFTSVTASIDGHAAPLTPTAGGLLLRPPPLADGAHTLSVYAAGHGHRSTRTVHLTVDATPPAVSVTLPAGRVAITHPVSVTGHLDAPDDRISAPGGTVRSTGTSFTVSYPLPPAGAQITVTDRAGNATTRPVTVPTAYPTGIRAVHMTGAAWGYPPLRTPVLRMVAEHRLNAVELDIKDEAGFVNFDAPVPLVQADSAVQRYYDPRAVAAQLHHLGARLIGRQVAFNDSKFADWAWAHGHHDWVVQNPGGSPYSYGYKHAHFSNFADAHVQDYNLTIAKAAVADGFDDVIFDYIRRPDGPISAERFAGLPTGAGAEPAAEKAITHFAQRAQATLRPLGGSVGAAIFAQAATRPQDTAQNVPQLAKYLDVVVPMDYPSHWHNGEYGVPNVYADPYAIVNRSLKDWLTDVRGTGCVVVPWLQDEDYLGHYGPAKVLAQINGARADGIPGWLMWSAAATYTPAAFSTDAPVR